VARQRQLVLAIALLAGACRSENKAVVDSGPPPFRRCPNPEAAPFAKRVQAARAERVRETRRLMGLFDDAKGEIAHIGRMPTCDWPPDVNERVAIAEKAFRARSPKLKESDFDARTAGCEEQGQLVVGLRIRVGYLTEYTDATYSVDRSSGKATYVGPGLARAHVDLDGDGRRDVVWTVPVLIHTMDWHLTRSHFEARMGSGKVVKVEEPWWEEPTGNGGGFFEPETGGVPVLEKTFVLLVGGGRELTRLRWDGKAFVKEARLVADGFDVRLDGAREREVALDFTQEMPELDRCAAITERDEKCSELSVEWTRRLERGGFTPAIASEMLRDHLGWPCVGPPARN
jgi:hypothetical protein